MSAKFQAFVAVMAISIGLLTLPVSGEAIAKEPTASEEITTLLKQRRDTLRKLMEVVTEQYRQGEVAYDTIVRASDELIDAELELATNRRDRIALLEGRVELMHSLSVRVASRFEAGQARHADMLAAKAALLQAKIQLTRERAGDAEAGR